MLVFANVFHSMLGGISVYNFKIIVGNATIIDVNKGLPPVIAQQEAYQMFSQVMMDKRPVKLRISTTSYIDTELDGSKREAYEEFVEAYNVAWTRAHKEDKDG